VPITVTCTCGTQVQTKDENAGRRARCPDCGTEIVIPGGGGAVGVGDEFATPPYKGGAAGTSGKAIASLVLGMMSLLCSFFTGIPAIILGVLGLRDIDRSHGLRTGKGLAIAGIVLGSLGCLLFLVSLALVIPAVQAAREAARRAQCVNNLKQIGLAMHNYASANDCLPPALIADADGRPMHSWRVAILPYMEASPTYNAYNFNVPWDSPLNATAIATMPNVYHCPSLPEAPPNTTTYQVLVGPGALFEGPNAVTRFAQVTDGTSNTLAVVESTTPVHWAQPTDITYTPKAPIKGLGSPHPGGFNALFADGSVKFLKGTVPPATLDKLATRAGNEPIGPDEY
jgi:prepilin-type processing-associated H-X9-DG protein